MAQNKRVRYEADDVDIVTCPAYVVHAAARMLCGGLHPDSTQTVLEYLTSKEQACNAMRIARERVGLQHGAIETAEHSDGHTYGWWVDVQWATYCKTFGIDNPESYRLPVDVDESDNDFDLELLDSEPDADEVILIDDIEPVIDPC